MAGRSRGGGSRWPIRCSAPRWEPRSFMASPCCTCTRADAPAHGAKPRVSRRGSATGVAVGANRVQLLRNAVRRLPGRDGDRGPVLRAAAAAMVLGRVPVRLLTNPVVMRMALLLIFVASVFILGVWFMRRMREDVMVNLDPPTPRADAAPAFAMATFQ